MKRTALCLLSAFLSVSLYVPCLLEYVRLIMKSAKSRTGKKKKAREKKKKQRILSCQDLNSLFPASCYLYVPEIKLHQKSQGYI